MATKATPDEQSPAPAEQPADTAPASPKPLDETVPGGRYVVNGRVVNAHGEPFVDPDDDERPD